MEVKHGKVLEACIETGIEIGWSRAHDMLGDPTENEVKDAISEAIWFELYNWFDFEGKKND